MNSPAAKAAAVLAIGALLYVVFVFQVGHGGRRVGQDISELTTTTLRGKPWKIADAKGKVILIDFWATWCGPCVRAMPEMKRLYKKYSKRPDFLMVGVSLDHDKQQLKTFLKKDKLPWLHLFEKTGRNRMADALEIQRIPSVWIIDRDGKVVASELHGPDVEKVLAEVLGS